MEYHTIRLKETSFTLGLVNDTPLLEAYYKVRNATLRTPWGRDYDNPTDDKETESFHLAVWDNEQKVVAVSRLHIEIMDGKPKGVVRYVGVLYEVRSLGLAKKMMRYLEEIAKTQGCESLSLASRDGALKMYLQLGYKVSSFGVHRWEQIPHWNCFKTIK